MNVEVQKVSKVGNRKAILLEKKRMFLWTLGVDAILP